MIETASLIVVNLLIAAFIGMIIGYLIGKNSGGTYKPSKNDNKTTDNQATDVKSKTSVNPIFRKNSSVDNKPLILSSPRPSGKDKLIKIKGIDEKVEKDLNKLGIFHFNQIAGWSNKNCDWIEEFLLLPGTAKKNQWIEQAKILESGKETVYSQKVENEEVDVS
jgi:predicted flap endonuclease-1-like 5' DNA nuclease